MSKNSKTFGKAVRSLRRQMDLTQEQLAERSGFHPVYISAIERGVRTPNLDSVLRLAPALQLTPGELLEVAFPASKEDPHLKADVFGLLAGQEKRDLRRLLAILRAYTESE